MMEEIENKIVNEAELSNAAGGRQEKTAKDVGKATKICHACQLKVDASYTTCPYCGGKLSKD